MKIDDENYYQDAVEPYCGPGIARIIASFLLSPKKESIISKLKALKQRDAIDLWKKQAEQNGEYWDAGDFFKGIAHQIEYCKFLTDPIQSLRKEYNLSVKFLLDLLQEHEIIREYGVPQKEEKIKEYAKKICTLYLSEYSSEVTDKPVALATIGVVENQE